jgi:hypothetical protein
MAIFIDPGSSTVEVDLRAGQIDTNPFSPLRYVSLVQELTES